MGEERGALTCDPKLMFKHEYPATKLILNPMRHQVMYDPALEDEGQQECGGSVISIEGSDYQKECPIGECLRSMLIV